MQQRRDALTDGRANRIAVDRSLAVRVRDGITIRLAVGGDRADR